MNRYFLEIREGVHRLPAGKTNGYQVRAEAEADAKRFVDDALPHNRVIVYEVVAYAYLAGDGSADLQQVDNGV